MTGAASRSLRSGVRIGLLAKIVALLAGVLVPLAAISWALAVCRPHSSI